VSADVSEKHIASIFSVEGIISARTSKQSGDFTLVSSATYFFYPEDGGDMFFRDVG
jgi:hypothetical protein